ncbi:MAG: accessory gene regulator B family protein [Clostridia bacterium]|nr:accessory gene regulator B family protein [Clostridia bacterium]
MLLIESISKSLTNSAKKNVKGMSEEQCEIVNYGLYVLFSDLIKMILLLISAYLLGIFSYSLISLVCFGLFRSFTGGIHAKTWLGCFIVNTLVIFGSVYLSIALREVQPVLVGSILFPICITITILFAPSDHENKPIVSIRQKKRLKGISLIILLLMYLTSLLIDLQPVSNIIMISVFAECLAILPVSYIIFRNQYGIAYQYTADHQK